jgi:hypothetical protein
MLVVLQVSNLFFECELLRLRQTSFEFFQTLDDLNRLIVADLFEQRGDEGARLRRAFSVEIVGDCPEVFIRMEEVQPLAGARVRNDRIVVALAGEGKKVHYDEKSPRRALLMVECGPESNGNKWLRCTVFEDATLASKVGRFMEGDYIRLKGHVRVWSRRKEGSSDEWEQNTEIRIEEIKGEPPKRAAKPAPTKSTNKAFDDGDDGLPW